MTDKKKTIIIFKIIKKRYNVTAKSLRGKTQLAEISFARTICGALIYNNTNFSQPKVGSILKRDASTIHRYTKQVINIPYFSKDYNIINDKIKNYLNNKE